MPTPSRRALASLALVAAIAAVGCDRKSAPARPAPPPATLPMSADKTIRYYHQAAVTDSLDPVVKALALQTIYVGVDNASTTAPAAATQPNTLRLKTGVDKDGHHWVYAYTTADDLARAIPQGAYVQMPFPELFAFIEKDPRFAGLHLNSNSDTKYPIPRELFDRVKKLLQK